MTKTKSVPDETSLIGLNLKQLRELKKLTQNDMALFLNVSYQQIQKYESGKNRLPIDRLYRIRDFFDIPFEYFFVGLKDTCHLGKGHQDYQILKDRNFYERCFEHYVTKISNNDRITPDQMYRIIGTLI
jgi:transcriptional regulator with XRE-family HTH domain